MLQRHAWTRKIYIQVTCNQKVIKIVAIDETLKLTQSNQEIIM